MRWKVERHCDGKTTTIRLIGRIREQYLEELQMLINESTTNLALDLQELMLADLESVRFLGRCQNDGIRLLHCSRYIEAWIAKEQGKGE